MFLLMSLFYFTSTSDVQAMQTIKQLFILTSS